jgi:hypothetical protein
MWGSLLWALGKRDKGTKEQRDKGIKKIAILLCAFVPLSLCPSSCRLQQTASYFV